MRVAYISLTTPFSRSSWSGIPYYSYREIVRRFPDTHVVDTPRMDGLIRRIALIERYGLLVRRRQMVSRYYGAVINAALEKIQPDVVVAVASAHKLARLDPKWPLVYAADALFETVVGYYSKYAAFGTAMRANGNVVQRELLGRADRVLLASDWAARSAVDFYGLPAHQVSVAPMGANLDSDPGWRAPKTDGPLSLLFVGYDWKRKGGDMVLATWRALRARTGNAELHIVGAQPSDAYGLEGVFLHGRLNKSQPQDYARFAELYDRASFFFMPSRQEAYGIVYCEAAAFGRPSIAANTGGVPTIVQDGKTGILLQPDENPDVAADRIMAIWQDVDRYAAMCAAARRAYETTLNWTSWGDKVDLAIRDTLADRGDHKTSE